jgi:predicted regulator of Ras-like GTPase activity (Roadblock/LC7/MglB family)
MKDQKLRDRRLVYYKEDFDQIEKLLDEYVKLSNARCVFLIDKEGHLVTQRGISQTFNAATLSALVAGAFAATKEMARLLGETEFSVMFHQGRKDNIHLSLVGDRAINATVFDEKTTVGMVNLYSKEVTTKLEKIFEIAAKKVTAEPTFETGYGDSVKDRLDDMFKE